MSIATIRASVAALLRTVSGVGVVNEDIPFGDDAEFFNAHFVEQTTGRINGWTVAAVPTTPEYGLGFIARVYTVTLRGILQVEKPADDVHSRAAAEAVADAIVTTFMASGANHRLPASSTPTVDWTDGHAIEVKDAQIRRGTGLDLVHLVTVTFRAIAQETLAA